MNLNFGKIQIWLGVLVLFLTAVELVKKIFEFHFKRNSDKKTPHPPDQDKTAGIYDYVKELGEDFMIHRNLLWKRGISDPYCLNCFQKEKKLVQIQTGYSDYRISKDESKSYPYWFCPACGSRPNIIMRPRWKKKKE